MATPELVRTVKALRKRIADWRAAGETVGLVPTMGALHDGHLTLCRTLARQADRIVATIFVNPTQFAPSEDIDRYPRDQAGDMAKLASLGVDLVFTPPVAEMYPDGFCTQVSVAGPAQAGLEDAHRPHFFGGVSTVVTKLLLQAMPDVAAFGEKDYQQLRVISCAVRDLNIPVKIVACKTVREKDGLAMSSRNAYLSPAERALACHLHHALQDAAKRIRDGAAAGQVTRAVAKGLERMGFVVDYVEARNPDTLAPLRRKGDPARLLVAAWLGKTRLIDNIAV